MDAKPTPPGPATTRRRPSASLVLGVLSGALAAVTVLPTIIPLTHNVVRADQEAHRRQVEVAVQVVAGIRRHGNEAYPGLAGELGVAHLSIRAGGRALYTDGKVPVGLDAGHRCAPETAIYRPVVHGGEQWVAACKSDGQVQIVAATTDQRDSAAYIAYLVLGLSAMVGISTALGVLQLLSPLSSLSRALERVGAGERGVRAATTGLAELDALVLRLNDAARAMEDREDVIMSRIRVVQQMARFVAHEIRNPLQSIALLTQLIASEEDETERSELSNAIHEEVRNLESVVGRMLRDTSGEGLRLNRTWGSVSPLVDKVLAFRSTEARQAGVKLSAGEVSDRRVYVDHALVSRSIENLVLNALQAVPSGTGKIRISIQDASDRILILVDDNGPGVRPELADVLFESDVSGRPGGSGLGLALVKGVMLAHGGTISHEPSPLGGARFRAEIPTTDTP